jgi:hypothetical protein
MHKMSEKETVLEDWSIVAFCSLPEIQKKYHLSITPFKQSTGRVGFKVSGNVDNALAELYTNKKILSYIKEIRSVRNAIFTLRHSGSSEGRLK